MCNGRKVLFQEGSTVGYTPEAGEMHSWTLSPTGHLGAA